MMREKINPILVILNFFMVIKKLQAIKIFFLCCTWLIGYEMLTWAVKKIFFSFWLSFEIQLKFLTDSWWTCATLQIAVLKCIFLSLVKKIYLRNNFTKSENFKVSAISSEEFSTMSFSLQSVEYFFAETNIEDWFECVW
jgi:hypothetical protein